ncbi:hypothetical protein V6N12_004811 [Hibiscus sabdariffa]|uniref:Uncharacterized protein n=1 Tax=Hibiscus sabdariffa TaxID=183260 RepID=A0ABR2CML9_9ROSI
MSLGTEARSPPGCVEIPAASDSSNNNGECAEGDSDPALVRPIGRKSTAAPKPVGNGAPSCGELTLTMGAANVAFVSTTCPLVCETPTFCGATFCQSFSTPGTKDMDAEPADRDFKQYEHDPAL